MNITELLVTGKSNQRPSGLKSDNKDKLRLSDFLQYPTLDDPEPESEDDDVVLRDLKVPNMHPEAALLISRLVESTGTLECLEVLHDAYKMYVDGELIVDIEADEWPDFWNEVLG
jgi:hypothetical protein